MSAVGVHLLETAGIEQPVNPLAGSQFSFGMLPLDRLGPASLTECLTAVE